jgi:hypothetical protein
VCADGIEPWNDGVRAPVRDVIAPSPSAEGAVAVIGDLGRLAARWRSEVGNRWTWNCGGWSGIGDVMVPVETMTGLGVGWYNGCEA